MHSNTEYRYDTNQWSVEDTDEVLFTVQATNDVHIALSAIPENTESQLYEIVLSGYGNTRSFIRKATQGEAVAVCSTVFYFKN